MSYFAKISFGLYVFLVPFDSISNITGGNFGTLNFLLGSLCIVFMAVECMYKHYFRPLNNITVWWICFIAYGALSVFWAIKPDLVLRRLPTALGLLLLYLAISSYQFKKTEYLNIKFLILYGGFCAGLFTIYSYHTNILYFGTERASLIVGERITDPNQFGFSIILPISLCIQQIITRKKFRQKLIFFSPVLFILLYSAIITGSRGTFLGVAVVFSTYIFLSKWKESRFLIFLSIGVLIILYFLIPTFFIERLLFMFESGGAGRLHIWKPAIEKGIEMFGIYGAGLNNFPEAYNRFIGYVPIKFGRASHNIYLGTFLELGIIGFMLLAAVIIRHYKMIIAKLISYNRSDSVMLRATFWGILTSSMFLDTMWRKSFWLFWMLVLINYNSRSGFLKD